MATLFSESFEEGTNGTAITTADSNFTNFVAPGTWVFSNAHVVPLYGSMAGKCTASAGTAIANAGNTVWASKAVTYYDWSFHVDSLPTSNATIHSFRNGGTAIADLRLLTTGAVQIRDGGFVQRAVSPAIATAGKDVRVQAKVDSTNGQMQLRVAVGSANITSGTWDYDSGLVAASSLQPTTDFQIGFVSSTTGVLEWGGFTVDDAAFPGPSANQPPTCSASASPSSATAGTSITFTATASDPDGTIASYAWDFGDGNTGTGATATHAYATSGTYTATLTVTDNLGATGTTTTTVSVLSSSGSVAIRGSSQNTNATSGATTTATVPAATVVGDKMLAIFLDGSGTSLTETLTASGWQPVSASAVGNNIGLHVWQKTAVSGDPGSTLTVTSSVDGTSSYKRTFVVVAAQGARMGNVGAVLENTAGTAHTAPSESAVAAGAMVINVFADRGSPGSTGFTLPANLVALQSYAHTGGAAVTSVVAYDDNVGAGPVGGNTATGTLSTGNAVMATIILEPGTPTNPPPTVVAGAAQSNVEPWTPVTVGGTDTAQGTATIASTQWTQISGADVTGSFSGDTTANLTFTTPGTLYGTTLGLRKTVTDSTGVSNYDDVQVDVLPATRRVVLGGVETPARRFYVSP